MRGGCGATRLLGEVAGAVASTCSRPSSASSLGLGARHHLASDTSASRGGAGRRRRRAVWTFGDPADGRLGRERGDHALPYPVEGGLDAPVAAALGGLSGAAVDAAGFAWTWGGGELGGPPRERLELGSERAVGVAAGGGRTMFATDAGRAWEEDARPARGGVLSPTLPASGRPLSPVAGLPGTVVAVACGEEHAAALTAEGDVWTWGDDKRGQLGRAGGAGWGRRALFGGAREPGRVENAAAVEAVFAGPWSESRNAVRAGGLT